MNIALLGYGRMGKSIEKIAIDRNHHIILNKTIKHYGKKARLCMY